ncbi:hypothetical protein TNCV_4294001 [Trichonephila clavipes]|uniref:Uncharacterized protein n=1 Tax=Trichonephila clavipes TaxID=2585209 RepID=A0A8X6RGT5_TRICX|nr:hypothetical protein TNCV_4294001 [Trichonephila clavipes]
MRVPFTFVSTRPGQFYMLHTVLSSDVALEMEGGTLERRWAKDLFRILSDLSFENRSAVPLTSRRRSRDSDGSHIAFDG